MSKYDRELVNELAEAFLAFAENSDLQYFGREVLIELTKAYATVRAQQKDRKSETEIAKMIRENTGGHP